MVKLLMESPALLFGPVVGLLVVLLLLLWLMGRRKSSKGADASETLTAENSGADDIGTEDISTEDIGTEDISAENSDATDMMGAFTIIRRDDDSTEADMSVSPDAGAAAADVDSADDAASTNDWQTITEAAIANASRLAAIEQEMLAVRDLYQQQKIDKTVYVAETRALFEEAKSLTSD